MIKQSKLNKISIIISYLSIFVSIIGAFFVTPQILNNIGDKNYGLYSFCTSITSWLTILTTAVGSSFIFFSKRDIEINGDDKKTNSLFVRIFISASLVIVALIVIFIPAFYFANISLPNFDLEESKLIFLLLGISGLQISASIVFNFYHLYLISKEKFFFVRLKNLFIEVALYILQLISAFVFKSIIAIAISSVITTVLSGIINFIMVRKMKTLNFYHPKHKELRNDYGVIIKYVSFVLINTLISTINNNIDKTILGSMVSPTYVTIYQLSFSFSLYLSFMINSIAETYMPQIHTLYSENKEEEAKKLFLILSKVQILLIMFIVGGFIASGYEFTVLWIGTDRVQVYQYASVLLILTLVPLSFSVSADCERANNKHKVRAVVMLIFAFINILLSILLIKFLGPSYAIWSCIIGTAVSKLLSEWVILPIYDYYSLKLPVKQYYMFFIKIFCFTVISVSLSLLVRHFLIGKINTALLFLIEGLIFVVVYILLLLLFCRGFIISFIKRKSHK